MGMRSSRVLRASRGRRQGVEKGVTLVELLVALALFSLIMVLLMQVFMPGLRLWKHTRAVADIEQQAMVAEEAIASAVLSTVASSIGTVDHSDLKALGLLSHEGTATHQGYDDIQGNTEWASESVFFVRPSDGKLYQTSWNGSSPPTLPYTFGSKVFKPTASQLVTLCTTSGSRVRKLADKVTELNLTKIPNEERFVLRLKLVTGVPGGSKSVEREVSLVPRVKERKKPA